MSFGNMNKIIEIKELCEEKDEEGFVTSVLRTIARVHASREGRHGSRRWANLAAFSSATDCFRIRSIPGVHIKTGQTITCDDEQFDITSVENVKGRGMYIELLAEKVEASDGKS